MANLQATRVTSSLNVQLNTFVRLGQAYISSGGPYAHYGLNNYFNGSAWIGSGPALQLVNNTFNFLTNPASVGTTPFSVDDTATTIDSTATKILVATGNSTTNSTLGIGAAAGTAAGDGKLLVNAAGTAKPFLEVTNCLGNGSTSTATFSVFKGYLGIKIGANVGPATSVTAGTYYLRLWSNA